MSSTNTETISDRRIIILGDTFNQTTVPGNDNPAVERAEQSIRMRGAVSSAQPMQIRQ